MLPAPNLDDRDFQSLVDEARRLVQRRCPEWSDHNISDPGITLIETFAMMFDQLIYRLNRVPDRHYIKFLELVGVEMRPPGAARGDVTFWLSAPQPHIVRVRAETEVSTVRTDMSDPVVFSTLNDLDIVPCSSRRVFAGLVGSAPTDYSTTLGRDGFYAFSPMPMPGDALLIGLSNPIPSCAALLRIDCSVSGVGVNPDRPPLAWEAWTTNGWARCDVDRDETGGFNKSGDVVIHVPATHTVSVIGGESAGWVRCRLTQAEPGQPTYTHPPHISAVTAATIGGTARIINARVVRNEFLGTSDGSPGQRFGLKQRPVLAADDSIVRSIENGRALDWTHVTHFADSTETDPRFHIDPVAAEVVFGPAVRTADGTLRNYGAVPPKGAEIRMLAYRSGGGTQGNVATGQIRVLKTSVPYVSRVENRAAAAGGSEPETIEDVKIRGPLQLRTRERAVTAEDFEQLARNAAPELARVQCLTSNDPAQRNVVRLLVVPYVRSDETGRIAREDLNPLEETLRRVADYLEPRRLVGTRLVVEPPDYVWLTVVAGLTAAPGHRATVVQARVEEALYQLFHPLTGGLDGRGWPLGRTVGVHEVAAALAWVPGVNLAEQVKIRLFPAESNTGRRSEPVDLLTVPPNALIYSHQHQVRVR